MSIALRDGLRTRALAAGTSIIANNSAFYKSGLWHNSYETGWEFMGAPIGALLASMHRETKTQKYLDRCLETWDWGIANLLSPVGYYVGDNNRTTFDGQAASHFGMCLSQTMWTLITSPSGNTLDATRQAKWNTINKAQVEWMDYTNNLTFYANGNWMLHFACWLFYTKEVCKAIGDTSGYDRMNALYERQIVFLNTPATCPIPGFPDGNPTWAGYGYTIDSAGVQPDKSDEKAHYTELTSGPPMPNSGAGTSSDGIAPFGTYDGDYAALQIAYLARWYVAARDARVQRPLNALLNKYLDSATTNITTWIGNFSHGSRHNAPANPIANPGLPVAALLSQRFSGTPYADAFTDAKVLADWDLMIGTTNWLLEQVPPGSGSSPPGITRDYAMTVPSVLLACEEYNLL